MRAAIQMFSVRNELTKAPQKTMERVSEIGYKNWEICVYADGHPSNYSLNMSVAEERRFYSELGVQIIGGHLQDSVMQDPNKLPYYLDYLAEIGCKSPGLALTFFKDRDEIKRRGEFMNLLGEMCRERGMGFHYHTQYFQFRKLDGRYVMDHILEATDPSLVGIELDTYWAVRGGVDPAERIRAYQGRICMLHIKDMPAEVGDRANILSWQDPNLEMNADIFRGSYKPEEFIEIGDGILDLQSIINAGNETGMSESFVTLEQDYTKLNELESIRRSMDGFKRFCGVNWN